MNPAILAFLSEHGGRWVIVSLQNSLVQAVAGKVVRVMPQGVELEDSGHQRYAIAGQLIVLAIEMQDEIVAENKWREGGH